MTTSRTEVPKAETEVVCSEIGNKVNKTLGVNHAKESTKMGKFVSPIVNTSGDPKTDEKKTIMEQLQFFKSKQKQNKAIPNATLNRSAKNRLQSMNKTRVDVKAEKSLKNSLASSTNQDSKRKNNRKQTKSETLIDLNVIAAHVPTENETEANETAENVEPDKEDDPSNQSSQLKPKESNSSVENKPFKCDRCENTFSYMKRYNDHVLKGECKVSIHCSPCNVTLKTFKQFKRHLKLVHERKLYQCVYCEKVLKNQAAVTRHMQSSHIQNQCKHCKKFLKNANGLRSHVYRCKQRKEDTVEAGSEHSDTEDNVGKENEAKASADDTKDDNQLKLNSEVKAPVALKRSKELKTKVKKVTQYSEICSLCGKTFNSPSGIWKHRKTHKQLQVTDPAIMNASGEMNDNSEITV